MLWSTIFFVSLVSACRASPRLDQHAEQLLHDRLFQTNLRGPRWTGNDNQNTLTALVADSMDIAGLSVETLDYTLWDPRWWSLSLKLTNGTTLGLPTTGYWPYSGDSGLRGVTAPIHDAGSYGLFQNQTANVGSLNLEGLPTTGSSILFFDNPSPTKNYSLPGYGLLGTSRHIPAEKIPEVRLFRNRADHTDARTARKSHEPPLAVSQNAEFHRHQRARSCGSRNVLGAYQR
ncbi:hypothetical protein C8J57DRAFT_1056241 [Mycena rebaudengoi]|nr:hypothetical protein C8J57DRAFT_1056241 [Mycena rebaudengoi]